MSFTSCEPYNYNSIVNSLDSRLDHRALLDQLTPRLRGVERVRKTSQLSYSRILLLCRHSIISMDSTNPRIQYSLLSCIVCSTEEVFGVSGVGRGTFNCGNDDYWMRVFCSVCLMSMRLCKPAIMFAVLIKCIFNIIANPIRICVIYYTETCGKLTRARIVVLCKQSKTFQVGVSCG